MKLKEIYTLLDKKFPFALAMSYDNSGYMAGDPEADVRRVMVCLDCTDERVDEAAERGAELILSHHPVIFNPLKSVTADTCPVIFSLVKNKIASIAMHTNLDIADGGLNDTLADMLELEDTVKFNVRDGVETAGLGRMGKSKIKELDAFCRFVKDKLGIPFISCYASGDNVGNVAVITGSGAGFLRDAKEAGADVLVTGDCKYYNFDTARQLGITLVDAGHFYTERIAAGIFRNFLQAETDLEVIDSELERDIRTSY